MTALLVLLAQSLNASAPLVLAAMTGVLSERAGVPMLALEGLMLVGAFGAAWGSLTLHAAPLAWLCAVLFSAAFAALFAWGTLRMRAHAIVAGVALNLLALGTTRTALKTLYGSASNSPPLPLEAATKGGLVRVAFVNVFSQATSWFAVMSVIVVHLLLKHSVFGLRVHAAGENPVALHAQGLSVSRTRAVAIVAGAVCVGLAGAHLSLGQHEFVTGMSGGRGYLALAAVILGRWRPVPAAIAAVCMGTLTALEATLASWTNTSPQLLQSLPFVVTLVAVIGVVGRTRAPAFLGRPEH